MDWLNNPNIVMLNKSLDGLWERERVISENISNFETPGYKTKYVTFEEELKNKMNSNQNRKIKSKQVSEVKVETYSEKNAMRVDKNDVDIDSQNIEMARTQLNYAFNTRAIDDYFKRLRTAINEGKK